MQYAELMDFCFVWLRKSLGDEISAFDRESTRTEHELTGNGTLGRGLTAFTQGISEVFQAMSQAMKPGAPLVFTYHHNSTEAYLPLVVAILDAGLTCTAVLPVPAEMAASLHIAGTKSSILDSVFVCREVGHETMAGSVDERVEADRAAMLEAGYSATADDLLCLRAGHEAARAIRSLIDDWNRALPLEERMRIARSRLIDTGGMHD